jgi:asparagine synthase (glutamine-hydrolysing)
LDGAGIAAGGKVFFAKSAANLPETCYGASAALGHVLHSVVGSVRQPLEGKGFFAANCEIYNWRGLAREFGLRAGNDAELLFLLLEQSDLSRRSLKRILERLDGVWAFAYWRGNAVVLARDLLGEKPLWYSLESGLCFASERKALEKAGCRNAIELNPRQVLVFDLGKGRAGFFKRKFFSVGKSGLSFGESKKRLALLLERAVQKRVPKKEFGLLFSGGLDSVLLAILFKRMGLSFKCFFAFVDGLGKPRDLAFAEGSAKALGLELETVSIGLGELPELISETVRLIESSDPIKVGVALPLLLACKNAGKHGLKVIFSGLGADELFAGYSRFRESSNVALDSANLLLQMHENDLYRDDVIAMNNSLELRLPFLDLDFVRFALSLPQEFKLSREQNKVILRSLAMGMGVPPEIALRKKTAAQYGSNFDKAIGKLAKRSGKRKAEFLAGFAKRENLGIAALFSGGKDSCLALWLMQRQNYGVECLVSVIPKNPDSFMYHRPNESVLKLQAKALGIPLVVERTLGEKEKELLALRRALARAKREHGIEGVVSGALYSNYQRERIQRVCNELGLKLFSPLWHKPQGREMRELVNNGFVFIVSRIAAKGLSREWLGKRIGKKEVRELEGLNKKFGFNVAGEGGEFETIVLDAPNFKKSIVVEKARKKMRGGFAGELEIIEASAVQKQ